MMSDAGAYAAHAGRKNLIHDSDLIAMMYRYVFHPSPLFQLSLTGRSMDRQRVLTDKCGLQALGRRYGLDRELQSVLDAMGPDGRGVGNARQKGRSKRKKTGEGGRRAKRATTGRVTEEVDAVSGDSSD